MTQEETLPFSTILDAIVTREPVPLHLLYRLSDMAATEHDTFRARWTAAPSERRRQIIRHLADLAEENYVVDFVPVFRDAFEDSDAAVRVAALDGVWDATDTRLIPTLTRLMQTDKSEEVRVAAAAALSHYVMLAEWGQIPHRFSEPMVTALLAEYDKADTAVPIKRAALEALGASNHPRVDALINEAYEDIAPALHISAVFAMGASADKRWLSTVLAEMENPDPEMRAEAARAAGNFGSSDALTPLERLTEDDDYEVRLTAVEALGHIGGEAARDILHRLMDTADDEEMEEAIAEALDEMSLFAGEFNLLDVDEDEE
jgi:HEAT repeat protein